MESQAKKLKRKKEVVRNRDIVRRTRECCPHYHVAGVKACSSDLGSVTPPSRLLLTVLYPSKWPTGGGQKCHLSHA